MQQHKKADKVVIITVAVVVLLFIGIALIVFRWGRSSREEDTTGATEQPADQGEVKLGDYNGITVSLKVTKDDLEAEIENLLAEHTTYEQLQGTAVDGDLVYASFEGYVDGVRMDTVCGEDYVDIGAGEWVDGFESGLIGATTGTPVSFAVTIPQDYYGDDSVDGKEVEFHVTVQYICGEEIVPEYNDDFIQSISKKYSTVKEYNAHLRKSLAKDYEANRAEYVWTDVLTGCKVKKYPEDILRLSEQEVLNGYYGMADLYGCSHDEIFASLGYEDEEDFKATDLEELAKETAKEYLVSGEIADREGIHYTGEDYQEVLEEEYSYVEGQYESQEAYEAADRERLEKLALMKAVKDWLAQRAEYTY